MRWDCGVGKYMGLWRLKTGERFALFDGFEGTDYMKGDRKTGFKEVLLSPSLCYTSVYGLLL